MSAFNSALERPCRGVIPRRYGLQLLMLMLMLRLGLAHRNACRVARTGHVFDAMFRVRYIAPHAWELGNFLLIESAVSPAWDDLEIFPYA